MHRNNQKFANAGGGHGGGGGGMMGGGGHGGGGMGGHGGGGGMGGGGHHGGGHHGGGHHGGGRWGGRGGYAGYPIYWGYPYWYDYPYYGDYPYYNNDVLVVEDGLIKRKKRKIVDTASSADGAGGGQAPPRPNTHIGAGTGKLKLGKTTVATPVMGVLGAVAGYFTAQAMGKPPIVGGVIGLALLGGGTMAYENFKK